MILTIAISIGKFLAIWTLASIIAAFVLARFFHAANQGQRDGQAHEPRRGGEVDFHKIHDPLIIEGAKQDHV